MRLVVSLQDPAVCCQLLYGLAVLHPGAQVLGDDRGCGCGSCQEVGTLQHWLQAERHGFAAHQKVNSLPPYIV